LAQLHPKLPAFCALYSYSLTDKMPALGWYRHVHHVQGYAQVWATKNPEKWEESRRETNGAAENSGGDFEGLVALLHELDADIGGTPSRYGAGPPHPRRGVGSPVFSNTFEPP
jgi:hypothetical protein